MLRMLSGNTHQVVTGLAVYDAPTAGWLWVPESTDDLPPLSEEEIECFVAAVRPLDRAGAYTVDGPGACLFHAMMAAIRMSGRPSYGWINSCASWTTHLFNFM